jgi:predicted cupin superfamily sugar epimerase
MTTAQQIIDFFGMKPLPNEGGFYVETYRCREKIAQAGLPAPRVLLSPAASTCPPPRLASGDAGAGVERRRGKQDSCGGDRNYCTVILYLLTPDTVSLLHRIKSDEIFHFYLGDAVTMLQLHPDGCGEVIVLGQDIFNGHRVQVAVPHGTWQGCLLNPGGEFALMGTTVAPGFEFADFEPANRGKLLEQYPAYRDLIIRLTR